MSIIENARNWVGDALAIRSLRRDRSRLGRRLAPAYTRYWRSCRNTFREKLPPEGAVAGAIAAFRREGIAAFQTPETERVARHVYERICARERNGEHLWATEAAKLGEYTGNVWSDFPELAELFVGPLGTFLMHYFGCNFKIFYGKLYKSHHTGTGPSGSQLWHADGGPGSCVNVMFYPHSTDENSGVLEVLPWDASLAIFERERKALRSARAALPKASTKTELRDVISDFYARVVAEDFADRVRQPIGPAELVVPFLNNNLHRGGYPASGRVRYAAVFHCYPSDRPADFARYKREGIRKTASYPKDPAAAF